MKPLFFFLFFIFLEQIFSFSIAQTHTVKIQAPETIEINPSDTLIEVQNGNELLLEIKLSELWLGGTLVATVNGTNVEPKKIDPENFEVKINKVTEDLQIVLSMESARIEGEILYDKELQKLQLRFFLPKELYAFIYTRYKKVGAEWIIDAQSISEPVPSAETLRSDDMEELLYLWRSDFGMSADIEYYVTIEYFRRYKGKPFIVATVTSPVFTLNEYPVSNTLLSKAIPTIYTSEGMLHIQTNSPCQAQIYTITGKLAHAHQVDINKTFISLPPGIYIVVIEKAAYKVLVE